jgi:hypothetical protein
MVIVGLDPGGNGQFGWCVAEATTGGRVRLLCAKTADHAAGAVAAVVSELGASLPTAGGIDSPLFWIANGDRRADQAIRAAMKRVGA